MRTNLSYSKEPIGVATVGKNKEENALNTPVKTKKKVVKQDRSVSARAAAREKRMKLERYETQEKRRATKIQVDQNVVLVTWIVGIAIAFLASAIVSFNGITSVAVFVGLSQAWMASLFFFFVELMYLLFLVAYLVLASRISEDGNPELTRGALWGMITFGGIAVLANAFHTLDYWEWLWVEPRMWAGLILSISAPIAIISASKMASRVVFAKAVRLD